MVEIAQVGSVIASLGECPVWDGDAEVLFWEDIDGRSLHRYDPSTCQTESRTLPGRPGSFVLTQTPGRLLVAMENELVWFDWASGSTTAFATVEDPSTGNRLNDGRCDHAGRFVVGTMHPSPDDGHFSGFLYSVDLTGAVATLESDVGVPNGLVFDPTRHRMYWTDTLRKVIWVWDYDLDSGLRSNKRPFFDYSELGDRGGLPDGGCLDAEGCYWSASVHGWALTRLTPDGVVDRRIDLPVRKPSMPAFGGADLSTLYVTSIGDGDLTASKSVRDGVPGGALLAIDSGVQGVPEPSFAI